MASDTIKAIDAREGCQIEGVLIINKVPGNCHISSHAFAEGISRVYQVGKHLDFSHTVNHFSFGKDEDQKDMRDTYGEKIVNELDGLTINQAHYIQGG